MNYITKEEVLFFHYRILVEFEPDNDEFLILNPGAIEAAVARPQQKVNGAEAYPDYFSKAAALTQSLISGHSFLDGNKRVGITAGCVFLLNNGFKIYADDFDIFKIAMLAAEGTWKFEELKYWFEQHFVKEM
jgi:death-on-curing protein